MGFSGTTGLWDTGRQQIHISFPLAKGFSFENGLFHLLSRSVSKSPEFQVPLTNPRATTCQYSYSCCRRCSAGHPRLICPMMSCMGHLLSSTLYWNGHDLATADILAIFTICDVIGKAVQIKCSQHPNMDHTAHYTWSLLLLQYATWCSMRKRLATHRNTLHVNVPKGYQTKTIQHKINKLTYM